jgi:hypothetical protein
MRNRVVAQGSLPTLGCTVPHGITCCLMFGKLRLDLLSDNLHLARSTSGGAAP